jgi:hypothetical protein
MHKTWIAVLALLIMPVISRADLLCGWSEYFCNAQGPIYQYTITAPLVTAEGNWDTSGSWSVTFDSYATFFYGTESTVEIPVGEPAPDERIKFLVIGTEPDPYGGGDVGGDSVAIGWTNPDGSEELSFGFAGTTAFWSTIGTETFNPDKTILYDTSLSNLSVIVPADGECPVGMCTVNVTPVPEPGSFSLLWLVGVLMWVRIWQSKKV